MTSLVLRAADIYSYYFPVEDVSAQVSNNLTITLFTGVRTELQYKCNECEAKMAPEICLHDGRWNDEQKK